MLSLFGFFLAGAAVQYDSREDLHSSKALHRWLRTSVPPVLHRPVRGIVDRLGGAAFVRLGGDAALGRLCSRFLARVCAPGRACVCCGRCDFRLCDSDVDVHAWLPASGAPVGLELRSSSRLLLKSSSKTDTVGGHCMYGRDRCKGTPSLVPGTNIAAATAREHDRLSRLPRWRRRGGRHGHGCHR